MLALFREASPILRDAHDVLGFSVHLLFIQAKFNCVSTSEAEVKGDGGGGLCPQRWNEDSETYCFQYKHPRLSNSVVLKMVRLEDMLMVHAMTMSDQKLYSTELYVYDYVKRDFDASNFSTLLSHEERLKSFLHRQLIDKILPPEPKSADASSSSSASPSSQMPPRNPLIADEPRLPFWDPDPTNPFGPRGGDFGRDIDPLAGRPGGFIPGGLPGSLMGPGHFGARAPGQLPRPRFDPFGPPGADQEPDPDHLRMPGPPARGGPRRPDFDRDIV